MNRTFRECTCPYQRQENWGYDVMRAAGEPRFWEPVGIAMTLSDIQKLCLPHPLVLVRCRGCGDDVLREYPQPRNSRP